MKKILLLFILLPIYLLAQSEGKTESGIEFTTLITAFIGAIIGGAFTLIGGYFTNKWNSKSQFEHFKKTHLVNSKKERISNLQNYIAEYIGLLTEYDLMNFYQTRILLPKLQNKPEERYRVFEDYAKDFKKIHNSIGVLSTKIITLLDLKNETQKKLYDKILALRDCITNPLPEANEDMYKSNLKLNTTVNEVRFMLSKLIQEEQSKLNELELS